MRIAREAEITLLSSPHTAELAPDGKHLVLAAAGLFACDLAGRTTTTFRKPSGRGAGHFHVTKSGRLVAQTASTIRVWNLRAGKQESELQPSGYESLRSVSRDASRLLTTSFGPGKLNRAFTVWDTKRGVAIARFEAKKSVVVGAAMSSDGEIVVHGGTDGVVHFFSVGSAAHVARVPARGWIDAVAASPDGRTFATGGRAGVVSVWNRDASVRRTFRYGAKIVGLALHDRCVVAWGSKGAPRVWALESGDTASIDDNATSGLMGGTRSVRFSLDGRRIVTTGNDCRVCISKIAL